MRRLSAKCWIQLQSITPKVAFNAICCTYNVEVSLFSRNASLRLPVRVVSVRVCAEAGAAEAVSPKPEYRVVNFYQLVDIPDPDAEIAAHRDFLSGLDIRGRIYISHQGVNAQFGGTLSDCEAYAQWVRSRPGFETMRCVMDPVPFHMFPKLRLKFRKSLISMAGGTAQYRITDPTARATPLEPAQWKAMIAEAKEVISARRSAGGAASTSGREEGDDYVVLDLRNDFEWDAGHFEGADRPPEHNFSQTPTGGLLGCGLLPLLLSLQASR